MKILSLFITFLLSTTAMSAADIGPSVNIPAGGEAVQTTPPESGPIKLLEPTRTPRRDTRAKLICSSADAAPQIAGRVAEGSCRTHTQQHAAPAQDSQIPWNPNTDITNAVTGR